MTARQKCGQLPPAAGRTPYCSVCAELGNIPHHDDDDMWQKTVDTIYDRLERLTAVRTLYHRRHRRW